MTGLQSCVCVRTQVPSSFSFHSLTVRPAEYDPGLAALTLRVHTRGGARTGSKGGPPSGVVGEVRVVHGAADVCRVVEDAVVKVWPGPEAGGSRREGKRKAKKDGDYSEGFWSIQTGESILDPAVRTRFVLDMFCGLCSKSWDIVSSCSPTQSSSHAQMYEVYTWILKKQVVQVPGVDFVAISLRKEDLHHMLEVVAPGEGNNVEVNNVLKHAVDNQTRGAQAGADEPRTHTGDRRSCPEAQRTGSVDLEGGPQAGGTSESGYISEEERRREEGPDPAARPTPTEEEDEDADLIENVEDALTLEDLESDEKENTLNTLAKAKSESKPLAPEESDPGPRNAASPGRGVVLRTKFMLNTILAPQPRFRESQEDQLCASVFQSSGDLISLLLDLCYRMFSRQWRLVSSTRLERAEETILLFQHDARILPGIGPQLLAGVSVDPRAGGVRLHNINTDKVTALCQDLRLVQTGEDLLFRPLDWERLYTQLIFSFGKQSLSFFNTIQSGAGHLLMFRPSNLVVSTGLCLSSLLGNTIRLHGASMEEVIVIRDVIKSRWPYSIYMDAEIRNKDGNTAEKDGDTTEKDGNTAKKDGNTAEKDRNTTENDGNTAEKDRNTTENDGNITEKDESNEKEEECLNWEWKVRRYPWRVSYGARLVDRAVERVGRVLSLPPPKHQDLESAKSILIFSIKELSEKGWKFSCGLSTNEETYLQFVR